MPDKSTTLIKLVLALSCSAIAVGATPAYAAGDVEQGINLYKAKDYAGAKVAFDRATRANAADWQAQYYLANCYFALGQMPYAKYAYQMCMHYTKDAAVIAQCKSGLDNIEKYTSQTRKPAAVPVIAAVKSTTEDDDADVVDVNSPQAKAAKAKEEIMSKAKAEVALIRKAAHEQIAMESANSNTICKYPDGSKALDIPYQRVDAINAEAEEKCARIMNEAEARCRGFR